MIQWIIITFSFVACSTLWYIKFSKNENPYLKLAAHALILPLWFLVAYVFLVLTVPQFENYFNQSSKAQRVSIYNDTERSTTFRVMVRSNEPDIKDNFVTYSWRAVYPSVNKIDFLKWEDLWQHISRFQPTYEVDRQSKVTYLYRVDDSNYDRMGVFINKAETNHALAFPSPDLPIEIYVSDLLPLKISVERSLSKELMYFSVFFLMIICLLYYLITMKGRWWLRIIAYLSYLLVIIISGSYSYQFGRIILNHYISI